jgi:hypothetical protein
MIEYRIFNAKCQSANMMMTAISVVRTMTQMCSNFPYSVSGSKASRMSDNSLFKRIGRSMDGFRRAPAEHQIVRLRQVERKSAVN